MKNRIRTVLAILAAALVAADCQAPATPSSGGKAGLTINVSNQINARTLAPGLDMNPANYTVTGTGPAGATFTAATSGGAVTKTNLAFGSWTVVVNATNSGGTLIGTGSATTQVNTASTSTVSVTVTPVSGVGTLNLGVSWPSGSVQTPSIASTLTPALGSAQTLPFSISGSSASYSNNAVGNGYYTLALTVKDTGVIVAGAVDVVRIVTGQTTDGTYAFTQVNAPGGTIQVNVDANLQNPLDVSIAGASANQTVGTTKTLTASVSNYSGNVVYVWYVNGVSAGTGSTFDFNTGSVPGYSYRVDVTAFSADGTRGGSATTNVGAVAASLDWFQPPEGPNSSPLTLHDDGTNTGLSGDTFVVEYKESILNVSRAGSSIAVWNKDGWRKPNGSGPGTGVGNTALVHKTSYQTAQAWVVGNIVYFLSGDRLSISSFDGSAWRYEDGTGSGTGGYLKLVPTGTNWIQQLLTWRNQLVAIHSDGSISSYDGQNWKLYDGSGSGQGVSLHNAPDGTVGSISAIFQDAIVTTFVVLDDPSSSSVHGEVRCFDGVDWKDLGTQNFPTGYGGPFIPNFFSVFNGNLVAIGNGGVASFDGSDWRNADGSGTGTGPYSSTNLFSQVVSSFVYQNELIVVDTYSRVSSLNPSGWKFWDGTGSGTGLYENPDIHSVGFSSSVASLIHGHYFVLCGSNNIAVYDLSKSQWMNSPMAGGGS